MRRNHRVKAPKRMSEIGLDESDRKWFAYGLNEFGVPGVIREGDKKLYLCTVMHGSEKPIYQEPASANQGGRAS